MPSTPTPKYRRQTRHNRSDSAFVVLNGERHDLGDFDSPESHEAYPRLLAEFTGGGGTLPVAQDALTVVELCNRFMRHAQAYYGQGREYLNHKPVVALLVKLYGGTTAASFTPKSMKAVAKRSTDAVPGRMNIQGGLHTERP